MVVAHLPFRWSLDVSDEPRRGRGRPRFRPTGPRVQTLLTTDEHQEIAEATSRLGLSQSEFVRRAALFAARYPNTRELKKMMRTGLASE